MCIENYLTVSVDSISISRRCEKQKCTRLEADILFIFFWLNKWKISSLKIGIVNNELFRGDIKSTYNEFGTCGEMWENAIEVGTKSWFCQN